MSSDDRDVEWLLVTDVDGTLVGDDEAYAHFVETAHQSPSLAVVLNSSRPTASVLETLEGLAPKFEPDGIVAAMGTEITHDRTLNEDWRRRFVDWDRSPIDQVMEQLGFTPHDASLQTPYKASYVVRKGQDQLAATEAIQATGQPARIIRSGDSDFDVLPPNAGKGEATLHVMAMLGVPFDRLIVAGDSANDLAMFEVAEKRIVVGNARQELRDVIDEYSAYYANRTHAAGLIEGLTHWGVPVNHKNG